MKRSIQIRVACEQRNEIGESPIWSTDEQALYWVDIPAGTVHRLRSNGAKDEWQVGGKVGAVGLRGAGGLVATLPDGVYSLELPLHGHVKSTLLARPELSAQVRLKEGKVDGQGRYWCGSTGPSFETRLGSLFRIQANGDCVEVDSGFILPNGIAFSPDGKTMIVADTAADEVFAFDHDARSGKASNRRLFFSTEDLPGYVDGATFDDEGGYWCALAYDGAVARFDAGGRLDRLVRVPTKYPTMCAFGGERLDVLYVTSSSRHVSESERAAEPLAGALFEIRGLGVRGLREPCCAL